MGFAASLYHLFPFSKSYPLSEIMHKLVSRETRTVASKGIWKAVLMYWVLMVGTQTLVLMAWVISVTRDSQSAISSLVFPCLTIFCLALSISYVPFMTDCTSLSFTMNLAGERI